MIWLMASYTGLSTSKSGKLILSTLSYFSKISNSKYLLYSKELTIITSVRKSTTSRHQSEHNGNEKVQPNKLKNTPRTLVKLNKGNLRAGNKSRDSV